MIIAYIFVFFNYMDSNLPPNPRSRQSVRHIIKSLKLKIDSRRTVSERLADWLTGSFGSMGFLFLNALWFGIWMVVNLGFVPGVPVFDPFPFGLLTMVVSLEAIFLAIIVLMSQNRAGKIADLREEIDLHIDVVTEQEVTKLIQLLVALLEKHEVNIKDDATLQEMMRPLDTDKITRALERQV